MKDMVVILFSCLKIHEKEKETTLGCSFLFPNYLHVYYNLRNFSTFTVIRTYTFIKIWKSFPPNWLMRLTRLLIFEKVSHLHCYWGPTLIRNLRVTELPKTGRVTWRTPKPPQALPAPLGSDRPEGGGCGLTLQSRKFLTTFFVLLDLAWVCRVA